MTLHSAILEGARRLEEARIAAPRLTAEVLLCHAISRERAHLYAYPERELEAAESLRYSQYLDERVAGKPAQYITGQQEFYGRMFRVSPAVLIPRPETEHVIEAALRLAPDPGCVVDVGCGSGAIAVTLAAELQRAKVWATDISFQAIEVARANAGALRARVHFAVCDLLSAIAPQSMDLVAANPPYVPDGDKSSLQTEVRDHEPEVALYGGPTGTEIYQRLIPEAARVLRPGGWLIMELGYRGLDAVRAMLDQRWQNVEVIHDLAGLPRVLAAQFRQIRIGL